MSVKRDREVFEIAAASMWCSVHT